MIDAKKAKEMTESGLIDNTNTMIGELERSILEATKRGQFYVDRRYADDFINNKIINTFELLGYKVNINVINRIIGISWY